MAIDRRITARIALIIAGLFVIIAALVTCTSAQTGSPPSATTTATCIAAFEHQQLLVGCAENHGRAWRACPPEAATIDCPYMDGLTMYATAVPPGQVLTDGMCRAGVRVRHLFAGCTTAGREQETAWVATCDPADLRCLPDLPVTAVSSYAARSPGSLTP